MVASVCVSQKYITFCGKLPFLACESQKMSTFCPCLSVCHLPLYHQDVRCVQCMKMDHLLPLNIFKEELATPSGRGQWLQLWEKNFFGSIWKTSQDTIIPFLSSMSTPSVILGELAASWHWCCGVHHHFATSPPGSRHPSPLPNAC